MIWFLDFWGKPNRWMKRWTNSCGSNTHSRDTLSTVQANGKGGAGFGRATQQNTTIYWYMTWVYPIANNSG